MTEDYGTPREIVAAANGLARGFYRMYGNVVPDDFRFYEATHPMEVGMWEMAVYAYDHIEGTDVNNALCELENDDGDE